MTDLWSQVEPLLAHVERPARYIDSEFGAVHRPGRRLPGGAAVSGHLRAGHGQPGDRDPVRRLNALEDVAAERVYVPWKDMGDAMRAAGVPLFTLESVTAVRSCDLFGITIPYELTCTNICEALDLAGIPLRAVDRSEADPVVVGGGPCAFNPEPVADFFDAILVGEGEDAVAEIVAAHRAAKAQGRIARGHARGARASFPGVYVPSLYEPAGADRPARPREGSGAPARVVKRVVADLGAFRAPVCPVVPFMDVVHDRANVEVLRGCTRGCRFCQAGMIYRPVRERTADDIVRDALAQLRCTGQEELSLTSLSTTDHSEIEDVLRRSRPRCAAAR